MKRMKAATSRFFQHIAVLLSVLFIVAGLFMSVKIAANNESFYRREFEKIGNAQYMGMSTDDLVASTMRMIDYMEGRVESIDITVSVNGERVSMFNDRERAHMVDVKNIYQGFQTASYIFIALYALFLLYWFYRTRTRQLHVLTRAFVRASILFTALLLAIVIFAAVDFTSFWTAFHHLLFTNDLWILNGATDRMIMMMPQQFFSDMVLRIVLQFVIPWALLLIGAYIYNRRSRRRFMKNSRDALRRAAEQHVAMELRAKKDD